MIATGARACRPRRPATTPSSSITSRPSNASLESLLQADCGAPPHDGVADRLIPSSLQGDSKRKPVNSHHKTVARTCLEGAESNTMTFPQIVGTLMRKGFEGYLVDFRRSVTVYYLPSGDSVELPTHRHHDAGDTGSTRPRSRRRSRKPQQLVPGYTYKGFCGKVVSAGCAGYMVSFSGRRALHFGRVRRKPMSNTFRISASRRSRCRGNPRP